MEDTEQQVTQQPVVEQVTSKTPATKQKNPKRVAAGKAIAQKTKQAREAQKKALAEYQVIIANNQLKPAPDPPTVADTPSADSPPSTKNVLTTTQWLSVINIIVSFAGIYYKREEIKSVFTKRVAPPLPLAPQPPPVDAAPTPIEVTVKWIRLISVLIYGL